MHYKAFDFTWPTLPHIFHSKCFVFLNYKECRKWNIWYKRLRNPNYCGKIFVLYSLKALIKIILKILGFSPFLFLLDSKFACKICLTFLLFSAPSHLFSWLSEYFNDTIYTFCMYSIPSILYERTKKFSPLLLLHLLPLPNQRHLKIDSSHKIHSKLQDWLKEGADAMEKVLRIPLHKASFQLSGLWW